MPMQVCHGAVLRCTFGLAPSSLQVLPLNRVMSSGLPAANIMDHLPMVNILPFGMCSCPANPAVMSATAAALGVLTPMPCVPVTASPWVPGSVSVLISNQPALNDTSQLLCTWGGVIGVAFAGQATHQIP
jgi:Domain of unknown function (DUF4280)